MIPVVDSDGDFSKSVQITRLDKCSGYYPILAYWAYKTWHRRRGIPFDSILKDYRRRSESSELPITWVAFVNTLPVGMVTLKKNDLLNRMDLFPWLSALFVDYDYRGSGIGTMLIRKVKKNVRKRGMCMLYLYADHYNTERLYGFYLKRGWSFLENSRDVNNDKVPIFFSLL